MTGMPRQAATARPIRARGIPGGFIFIFSALRYVALRGAHGCSSADFGLGSKEGPGQSRGEAGENPGSAGMRSLRVRFEEFELDTARLQLLRAGEPVHLTPMAFRLLAFLIEA